MHVVATAGHVDHGKSTLVRALTGTDPDRLEEERRRGLTIELGYAWTDLPGVGEVAFVDVPGHERFLTTALSGVGPVPVALLVVAADDPWMPQAAEHLAALDALGVRHGLLVVTRTDLADPGPILARAREELARTTLAGAPAVAVSARTGAGLDLLHAELATVLSGVPAPDPDAPVRLWVDRSFHVRGSGTVVTGTLPAGTVRVGDVLEVEGVPVRVRDLECLGRPRESVSGVARVALDLGGKTPDGLGRGSVLVTPDAYAPTTVVDVRVDGPGRLPERPVLHVGATSLTVHARPLAGELVRLRSDRPLPLRVHDRAVLRDPGSRAVWGVRVLDPAPPGIGRRGAARQRAEALAGADGRPASELARRGPTSSTLLRRIGVALSPLPEGTVAAGDWLLSAEHADRLADRLRLAVEALPLGRPGLSPAAVCRLLDLPDPALVPPLVRAPLAMLDGRVALRAAPVLTPRQAAARDRLRRELAGTAVGAPEAGRLAALGLDPETVAALHRAGEVLRLEDNVVTLPEAVPAALSVLRGLPQPFTTSEARRALGTTRRVALPLLAHLDRTGRTVRLADDRRRLREGGVG